MRRGAALTGALLATLATPASWPLALAAFLIRGGFLVVTLPIVVLPTTVQLANLLAPDLSSVALGTITVELALLAASIGSVVVAWLVLGGWLAAALEAEGARLIAADVETATLGPAGMDAPAASQGGARIAARILAARLIAYPPLAVVLSWGSARLVIAAYYELTAPVEVVTPIIVRVVRGSPDVIVAILIAWTLGEIVGAAAARRITLAGDGVLGALRGAVATSLRQPLSVLVRFWLPTLILLLVAVPSALAAGSAWDATSDALGRHADPILVLLTVVLFIVLWIVGLLLVGVVCAWRAAVWTIAEVAREGTFGVSADRRPGDWHPSETSATL